MLPDLASLWIGGEFSAVERLSAQSFLDYGHRLTVYSYEPIRNLPDGIEQLDAVTILKTRKILRYNGTGSPALHSNLFRYALLQKTNKIWVDLDIIALKPFDFLQDYVFGMEDQQQVNSAVLRLPQTSSALVKLCRFNEDSFGYLPATTLRKRLGHFVYTRGRRTPIEQWPWGATGPRALTGYLKKTGEISNAMPREAFYPVSWQNTAQFIEPGRISQDHFGSGTYGVHLWGKFLRRELDRHYSGKIPATSFVGQMLRKHKIYY